MYTRTNYRSKAALKRDFAAGVPITTFQPNAWVAGTKTDGRVALEGPHYPDPHTWYADVTIKDGIVTKIHG